MTSLRRAMLALAFLCLAWAGWLIVRGGFETSILGVTVKSNEPFRAIAGASVALALYAAVGGLARTLDGWSRRLASLDLRVCAVLLACGSVALGLTYATTAGIGPDPYGYVSEADLWLHGTLEVSQPWARAVPWPSPDWTFSPLGYRPGREPSGVTATRIVPTYSPGLPMLMAAAKRLAGQRGMFWIVPLTGAALVLATFGIGRRLGSEGAGLAGAWLVATSPAYLFIVMQPMSDVPAAAFWAMATYFVLASTTWSAAAAGACAAVAMLIRPNLWPLAGVLALWPALEAWTGRIRPADAARHLLALVAVSSLGALGVAAINRELFGSALMSGYGNLGELFSWSHVLPNLRHYLGWLADTQTPLAVAGLAALAIPSRRLWPHVRHRHVFVVIGLFVLVVWGQYCAYEEFEAWWFLRYLLPTWPLIMVAVGFLAVALAERMPAAYRVVAMWTVFMLGVSGMQLARDRGAFNEWRNDRRFIDVSRQVRQVTGDSAIVFTMYQSGSLRYYGGRQTLRFDYLAEDWLDRSVRWFSERGVHPYALFSDREEVESFRRHFAGQRALERLDDSRIFTYRDDGIDYFTFFDLLPDAPLTPRLVESSDFTQLRNAPPLTLPQFTFTQ